MRKPTGESMAGAVMYFRVAERVWSVEPRGEESLKFLLRLTDSSVIRRRLYKTSVTCGRQCTGAV